MEELLHQSKPIIVDGQQYTQQRLSVVHIFSFIKILKQARIVNYVGSLINDFSREDVGNEERIGAAVNLVFTLVEAETEIYDLFGKLLGVSGDEFKNFPPETLIDVTENIVNAPDLKAFFNALKRLLPKEAEDTVLPVTEAMTAPLKAD